MKDFTNEPQTSKKTFLFSKIAGVTFDCKNPEDLKVFEDSCEGVYDKGIINYAKSWARLMQLYIGKGSKLVDIAMSTSHEADVDGITGRMFGGAVNFLSEYWVYGEDLRKWHNKQYGYEGDGVVNPALFAIISK